jgi:hypothetical protein
MTKIIILADGSGEIGCTKCCFCGKVELCNKYGKQYDCKGNSTYFKKYVSRPVIKIKENI